MVLKPSRYPLLVLNGRFCTSSPQQPKHEQWHSSIQSDKAAQQHNGYFSLYLALFVSLSAKGALYITPYSSRYGSPLLQSFSNTYTFSSIKTKQHMKNLVVGEVATVCLQGRKQTWFRAFHPLKSGKNILFYWVNYDLVHTKNAFFFMNIKVCELQSHSFFPHAPRVQPKKVCVLGKHRLYLL